MQEEKIELTRAEIEALNKHNEKVKRELAREIFEEIDKIFCDYEYLIEKESRFLSRFAELKKKYTEGENNNE